MSNLNDENVAILTKYLNEKLPTGNSADDCIELISKFLSITKQEAKPIFEAYRRARKGDADEANPFLRAINAGTASAIVTAELRGTTTSYLVHCSQCNGSLTHHIGRLQKEEFPRCPHCGESLSLASVSDAAREVADEWKGHVLPMVVLASFAATGWCVYQAYDFATDSTVGLVVCLLGWSLLAALLGYGYRRRGGSFLAGFFATLVAGPLLGLFLWAAGPTTE